MSVRHGFGKKSKCVITKSTFYFFFSFFYLTSLTAGQGQPCAVTLCRWSKSQKNTVMPGGTTAYLVCYAVEDLHGQVGHLRERVCSQMKQDPPDLSVNAVEGHTCNKKNGTGIKHMHTLTSAGPFVRMWRNSHHSPSKFINRERDKRLTRANSYVVMHCSSHKHHVTRSGHFLLLHLSDVLRWQRVNDLQCQVMYIINHSVCTHTHACMHTLRAAGFPHLLFRCS